ncbi:MAG: hypothetical protein ACRDP4_05630 [Nocardioidaceae bacterium]
MSETMRDIVEGDLPIYGSQEQFLGAVADLVTAPLEVATAERLRELLCGAPAQSLAALRTDGDSSRRGHLRLVQPSVTSAEPDRAQPRGRGTT